MNIEIIKNFIYDTKCENKINVHSCHKFTCKNCDKEVVSIKTKTAQQIFAEIQFIETSLSLHLMSCELYRKNEF